MSHPRTEDTFTYSGRRTPTDSVPLRHNDYQTVGHDPRTRRDSQASSFFGRTAAGEPAAGFSNAAYNRDSYYNPQPRMEPVKGGDEPEEGWDVYADFNNAGPRYANHYTGTTSGDGYRALSPTVHSPLSGGKPESLSNPTAPVELVTVPAFGPEWKASELREMTKAGKSEIRADKRKVKFKAWWRDQRGLCGVPWLTRKNLVWITFGLIIVIAVLLIVTIPRVPNFNISADQPFVSNSSEVPVFNRVPANFSFDAKINIQIDTHGNILPVHFNHLNASVYMLGTTQMVAGGDLGPYTAQPKQYIPVQLPITFSYLGVNTSDPTWTAFYNACKNKGQVVGGVRPGLQLYLVLQMSIRGLIGQTSTSTSFANAPCPIELSQTSV
ncbi:hypothetical protein BOTBODRAFT_140559 [Botryobasidium botryosum FD-172 SS1]|uniref:Uncharacterized protein n=1 Tax=Botryobasidium botryosum (strain FD-172 SS1) TaxID=930990 RepID=A0A067LV23_BOTB1|nr:hypothetical protein BOTBODRAFT_140559 [Botryobasidium botryosum FD-172 SS1]